MFFGNNSLAVQDVANASGSQDHEAVGGSVAAFSWQVHVRAEPDGLGAYVSSH